jgi:hypothetical protein
MQDLFGSLSERPMTTISFGMSYALMLLWYVARRRRRKDELQATLHAGL